MHLSYLSWHRHSVFGEEEVCAEFDHALKIFVFSQIKNFSSKYNQCGYGSTTAG